MTSDFIYGPLGAAAGFLVGVLLWGDAAGVRPSHTVNNGCDGIRRLQPWGLRACRA